MMKNLVSLLGVKSSLSAVIIRNLSVSAINNKSYTCKLLVLGGGSGGCTIAAKFARKSGTKDSVIILEPNKSHYYQPLWTLVGAGVTRVAHTRRDMVRVLPKRALWLQDFAETVNPGQCQVVTKEGHVIKYEYLVVAVGITNDYDKIPGLKQALEYSHSSVSTIYDSKYCEKTFSDIRSFRGGEAVFTYPDTPIKCPGAPQKIAYLAESFFSRSNVRAVTHISYNTCLPVIFGVKKYADSLLKVAERKNIDVNYRTVLKEIRPECKEAVFRVTDKDDASKCEDVTMSYGLLHVTPPMRTPDFLRKNEELADPTGYLDVDKHTLQHVTFKNIYGIGDCTNTPNSKTAAAIAKQCWVLEKNLMRTMQHEPPTASYDGYGACPLLTSYGTCILAEFLYGGVVHETFPFDQSKESRLAWYMKKDLFPFIYWNFMLRGWYHGPEIVRKIINPFGK